MTRSHRFLRAWLWASGVLIALWTLWLAGEAWDQQQRIGQTSGLLWIALALGATSAALTPLCVRAIDRFARREETPFWTFPAYYRAVGVIAFGFFLAVVFGSRAEMFHRLAAHLLAAALLHRLALCFPAVPQRAVLALVRVRALRVLDITLTNLVVAMVVGELVLRLVFALTAGGLPWLYDRETYWDRKIKFDAWGLSPNELGYNDREFVRERGEALRLAALGDSLFVAAVPRPFGVIRQLEARLAELRPQAPVEVYNFAIMATNVWDYLAILDLDVLDFSPDVVLVGVYVGNDIQKPNRVQPLEKRAFVLYQLGVSLARYSLVRQTVEQPEFVDITQLPRSDAEYWYGNELPPLWPRSVYLGMAANALRLLVPTPTAHQEEEWQSTFEALRRIHERLESSGVRMMLSINPDQVQVSPALRREIADRFGGADLSTLDPAYPSERLLGFCHEEGIPCLDLLPAFTAAAEAAGGSEGLFLPNDNHWSAEGNRIAGLALAEWLDRELPARRGAQAPTKSSTAGIASTASSVPSTIAEATRAGSVP